MNVEYRPRPYCDNCRVVKSAGVVKIVCTDHRRAS